MSVLHYYNLSDETCNEMIDYCQQHKLTLIKYECTDISDLSLIYDNIITFEFSNDSEILLFKLRFGGK